MKKVLLFGATGNLGKAVAKAITDAGYELTVVVRNASKANELKHITDKSKIAAVTSSIDLIGICEGFDVVVSTLGKSVSPNDKSKPSFRDIDLNANTAILEEAKKANVKKFVYVSAFQDEQYKHLEYFYVHHEFTQRLIKSGIDYSIIKPPAIFCAFLDFIEMAKRGKLMNLGKGDKKTNPIYEGDLAKVIVDSIEKPNCIIEAGGKKIYTRKQLCEIVQQAVDPTKKINNVPMAMVKLGLPFYRLFDKNTYHKFAFFTEVMEHDTFAPQVGNMSFEEYVQMKTK